MALHVKDTADAGSVVSVLKWAEKNSMVADADFATDEATTIANIRTRNANIHTDKKPMLESIIEHVKLGFRVFGATTMIADLATIYAAGPGWETSSYPFSSAL